ncbi:sulfatase family protein [Allorhodopirellula solitaria]|nr:sulfatase-like hydrolase/transferase [Allorhodopirellula solitaria]
MKLMTCFAVIFASISLAAPGWADEATPPNVILILSDDHGFPDYGFMGSEVARTPNLDRMAAESLLYTRGYVMPVCSPSLASLLTGRLPHSHGITGNDLSQASIEAENAKGKLDRDPLSQRLLANSPILPQSLDDAGYVSFQTGKLWNVTAEEVGFTQGMTNREGRHGGEGLAIGRKSMDPIYKFIDSAVDQEKPFFVWYAPLLPHLPHNPPEELLARYQDQGLSPGAAKYYAMVEWFDQTCGELDDYLDQNDLADNTVVIYLADNGWDAERQGRAKLSPFELGIRTPIFVRWPGKVQPQRDETTLASILDVMPTIFSACGIEVPDDLPGLNLVDHQEMQKRDTVFVEGYTHDIADLDKPEKSLVTRVVIDGWNKLVVPGSRRPDKGYTSAPESVELFDLKSDPLEKQNLAAEQPQVVDQLKGLLKTRWDAGE